jgi:hypothetical protein
LGDTFTVMRLYVSPLNHRQGYDVIGSRLREYRTDDALAVTLFHTRPPFQRLWLTLINLGNGADDEAQSCTVEQEDETGRGGI